MDLFYFLFFIFYSELKLISQDDFNTNPDLSLS